MNYRAGPGRFKCKFTPAEDLRLLEVVDHCGCKDWSIVARHMFPRNARQCRERWTNYINPVLVNQPWTQAEEDLLGEKFAEYGRKWQSIAAYFPNRSKNQVKNHWISRQKRLHQPVLASETKTSDKAPPPADKACPPAQSQPRSEAQAQNVFDIMIDDSAKDEIFWEDPEAAYFQPR
jgi:hypothetical protein